MRPAKSEDSRNLIRIFTWRFFDSETYKIPSCGKQRLLSDCVDAQADKSLRWANMSEGMFSDVAALDFVL